MTTWNRSSEVELGSFAMSYQALKLCLHLSLRSCPDVTTASKVLSREPPQRAVAMIGCLANRHDTRPIKATQEQSGRVLAATPSFRIISP